MEMDEAIELIRGATDNHLTKQTWADLGCGTGTFTKALASLLPPGSTIHAVDRQMQSLPEQFKNAAIHFHQADFERDPLNLSNLNGILLANALHYVKDAQSLLTRLATHLQSNGRFLLIEYDRRNANRWVPYPVPFTEAVKLFRSVGFNSVVKLGERPSTYGQAIMYSCVASKEK